MARKPRAIKFGKAKKKATTVTAPLTESVQRRNRLRILELAGKIRFDPNLGPQEDAVRMNVLVDTCVWSHFLHPGTVG